MLKDGINNFKKKIPLKYKKKIKIKSDSEVETTIDIVLFFLEMTLEFISDLD